MNGDFYFVSYARKDVEYKPNYDLFQRFFDDLSAAVAGILGRSMKDVPFLDARNIELGTFWDDELRGALEQCRVGVPFLSPSYFTSSWCGREFQVFLERTKAVPGKVAPIVPVWWTRCMSTPDSVGAIERYNDTFPREYSELGLAQLMRLSRYADEYQLVLARLAELIAKAMCENAFSDMEGSRIAAVRSAWDIETDQAPDSHCDGGIGKCCFVFASNQGWAWTPYPESRKTVGMIAQQISGSLALRYEEIAYDAAMPSRLQEANKGRVPTIIFGDPRSLLNHGYAKPMVDYDQLYLLNCGALVPWQMPPPANEPMWTNLRTQVCRQKTLAPPPFHDWNSISNQPDLESKTTATVEGIRMRLLQQILDAADASPALQIQAVRKESVVATAAEEGIRLDVAPQIRGPVE